ncbi:MAG: DUF192 domain-containing protein [Planctomycetota bacterium]|jgi:uncharacterized membrane protein (UPF0127 family)
MVHRDTRDLIRRLTVVLVAICIGFLCAATEPREPKPPEPPEPPREEIVIAGETFKLEVAADARSRAQGLMERTEIDEHGGMLFIYRDVRRRSFWMKNCLVDIDLLYLGSKGRIVGCHKMKKEPRRREDETEAAYEWRLRSYRSRRPAQFVIELKAGSIDRLKIKPGQTIELDYSRLRKMAR